MMDAFLRIGVDLDNTIIGYDEVFAREASARGLLPAGARLDKRTLRDRIRQSPDGDRQWQRIQAVVYGAKIDHAILMPGVADFFRRCCEEAIPVVIISHKTEFAPSDETRTNLREAAVRWLKAQRLFGADGLGLNPEHVHFASTRREKIARIVELACTHFIDDLEETFLEPEFPLSVGKILLRPSGPAPSAPGVVTARNWQEIHAWFFTHHDVRR